MKSLIEQGKLLSLSVGSLAGNQAPTGRVLYPSAEFHQKDLAF